MESSFVNRLNKTGGNGADRFQTSGAMIMEIAEWIRPILLEGMRGWKNAEGVLYRPEHIRAVALNVAHDIVKKAS